MPVRAPSASSTGRTLRLCSSVRRAMSSARSSTEMPAFTRRTFAWDSTSLLKGMSWDRLRTILGLAVAMSVHHEGPAGRLTLDLQNRTKVHRPPPRLEPHPSPACRSIQDLTEIMGDEQGGRVP